MSDPRAFSPLPWQVAPWADTRKTMVLAGGAGSGKSLFAFHKLNALCMRFPGSLGLIVRKARQHLRNSSIPMMESIIGGRVVHEPSKFRFQYPNGSRIVYGGMFDQKQREALRSIVGESGDGVDFAVMEEASTFTEADYEEVTGRLRGRAATFRQVMLPTNPDADTHWINQRFIRPHLAGSRLIAVYLPRPEDNPYLDRDYIETLKALTGVRRARLYEGRWVRAEGTVFEVWEPSIHIVDPFEIPRDWRRARSIDLGYVNPRVCGWAAIDGDGRAFIYRELYKTKQLTGDFAKQIIRCTKEERIEATVCDHDAEGRADLEAHGIPTVKAIKEVSLGIDIMTARIAANRLFWMRGCLVDCDEELKKEFKPWSTVQEFDCYVWKRNTDGTITKEEPEKKNDHGMDMLRYLSMYLDRDAIIRSPGAPLLGEIVKKYSAKANPEMEVW